MVLSKAIKNKLQEEFTKQSGQNVRLGWDLMLTFPSKCTSAGTFPSLLGEMRCYVPFSLTPIFFFSFTLLWMTSEFFMKEAQGVPLLVPGSINAKCTHLFPLLSFPHLFHFLSVQVYALLSTTKKWVHWLFKDTPAKDCYPKSKKVLISLVKVLETK